MYRSQHTDAFPEPIVRRDADESACSVVRITEDGRLLAEAEVHVPAAQPDPVRVSVHVGSGHVPPHTRARLLDRVLTVPGITPGRSLDLTIPLGDPDLLDALRARCRTVRPRAAGATCLVHAVA
jgi:hypothetical protein